MRLHCCSLGAYCGLHVLTEFHRETTFLILGHDFRAAQPRHEKRDIRVPDLQGFSSFGAFTNFGLSWERPCYDRHGYQTQPKPKPTEIEASYVIWERVLFVM